MDFSVVVTANQLPLLTFAIATIIGLVNTVQMTFPKLTGIYGLLMGVAFGLGGGYLGIFGLTPSLGLLAAFAASGIYKVATKAGGN